MLEIITTHVNTDLDGLGAAVAAQKIYPNAAIVFPGKLSKNVEEFLALHKDTLNIKNIRNIELDQVKRLIVVDTKHGKRLGKFNDIVEREDLEIHIYDHHPRAEDDLRGEVELVDDVGATVTLLVEKIKEKGIPVASLEATIMMMGIYGDTGALLFTSTTSRDLDAASFLLDQGAKLSVVSDFLGRPLTEEQKSLFKNLVMSSEHFTVNGLKILLAGASMEEFVVGLAPLTHILSEIEKPDAVFTVVEMEDRVHVVGRSNVSQVEVNKILSNFGGGGHAGAASATVKNAAVGEVLEKLKNIVQSRVESPLRVADIMSTPVKTVFTSTTIAEANQVMLRYGHTGLPVVDNDEIVGIISRRDVEKANHHGLGHAPVKGFMSTNVYTVPEDTTVYEVQNLMIEKDIGRLPVTRNNRPVGIVSRSDLLRTLHGEIQHRHRVVYSANGEISSYNNIKHLMQQVLSPSVWNILVQAGRIASDLGYNIYAAGGLVRDVLLGEDSLDVDLVVEGDGIELAGALGAAYDAVVRTHEKFNTAEIEFQDGLQIDIATARVEFYEYPAALPQVESSSLRQDLYRRDFTINAMAVSLGSGDFGRLVDYFGGREDLMYGGYGLVRVLHNLSFVEDPTRILRAVRFEQRYGMVIESQTKKLMTEAVQQDVFNRITNTRLWDELKHLLDEYRAGDMLARLYELGVWPYVFPGVDFKEVKPVIKNLGASLSSMKSREINIVPDRWLVYIIGLLHRSSQDTCRQIAKKYNFSKNQQEKILACAQKWEEVYYLVSGNSEAVPPSEVASRLLELPVESYPVLLAMMDEEKAKERFFEILHSIQQSKPYISGNYIKSLGYPPGPVYREVLDRLWRARLDGEVATEEEEKRFVCRYLQEIEGEKRENV